MLGVLIVGCSAILALLAAGCGSGAWGDALSHATGTRLAEQSNAVARRLERGDNCGAARAANTLRTEARRSAASRKLSDTIRRELLSRVNALASSIVCLPAAPPVVVQPSYSGNGYGGGGGEGGDD